jgi:hypothetical protein
MKGRLRSSTLPNAWPVRKECSHVIHEAESVTLNDSPTRQLKEAEKGCVNLGIALKKPAGCRTGRPY